MFNINFNTLLNTKPRAIAQIKGSKNYPQISGNVYFYPVNLGIVMVTIINNLPCSDMKCKNSVFAFHIHEGTSCTGDESDYFKNSLTHYNPDSCAHPYHAGDLPPLFCVKNMAFSSFLTDRFNLNEIIGKTVIIHSMPDDFRTQPSGNAGEKIACSVIKRINF